MTMASAGTRELNLALATYLGAVRGEPIVVDHLARLSGGASHDTWGFIAHDPAGNTEELVLRRDLPQSLVAGDLRREYALLDRLHVAGHPVARPRYLETDPSALGAPFMIVERIRGTDLRKALAASGARDPALGQQLVAIQAAIHAWPWLQSGLPCQSYDAAVSGELARWRAVVTNWQRPLLTAASNWLASHVPAPGQLALVHGDFKANNIVCGEDGKLTVIDWEMSHVGDPYEDLAWTLLWTTSEDLVGGLLDREAYLAAYALASGRELDHERLFFWEIFALLKLAGIFLRAAPEPGSQAPLPSHLMLHRALADVEARLSQRLLETIDQTPCRPTLPDPPPHSQLSNATPDALTTLTHLRQYFAHVVLPLVPPTHAGEFRAALKMLAECAGELDAVPLGLRGDCVTLDALIRHCTALAIPSPSQVAPKAAGLALGAAELYAALVNRERWLATAIPGLQSAQTDAAASALHEIFTRLGGLARNRARWQSVFPGRSQKGSGAPD